uniref:Uncharacterized protein n=1 Tax=Rhizophora mucronata TaxID=61149 RepID=A0A2P2MD64_RHIMU
MIIQELNETDRLNAEIFCVLHCTSKLFEGQPVDLVLAALSNLNH